MKQRNRAYLLNFLVALSAMVTSMVMRLTGLSWDFSDDPIVFPIITLVLLVSVIIIRIAALAKDQVKG